MDSVIRWSQSQKWRWEVLWPDQHWSQKSMLLNLCMCSTQQQHRPLLSLRYGIISRETIQSHGLITWRCFILTSADNNMYMNLTSLPDNISIYKHKNVLFSPSWNPSQHCFSSKNSFYREKEDNELGTMSFIMNLITQKQRVWQNGGKGGMAY